MGNLCCCFSSIRDGGRRRKSNVSPAIQPPPPHEVAANRFVFAPATPYPPDLCPKSNPYTQYPGYYPTMMPLPSIEYHRSVTIHNDVNLRKETLSLQPDPENPGQLLVSFSFDATVPGRFGFPLAFVLGFLS